MCVCIYTHTHTKAHTHIYIINTDFDVNLSGFKSRLYHLLVNKIQIEQGIYPLCSSLSSVKYEK